MISARKPKTKLLPKFYILPFFLIIGYILFLLGKTVWQNYQVNKSIRNLQNEINQLAEDNKNLQNQIQYYQSTTYKEEQARLKLGYQKPGEKVFVVVSAQSQPVSEKNNQNFQKNPEDLRPNYLKWWEYLFK